MKGSPNTNSLTFLRGVGLGGFLLIIAYGWLLIYDQMFSTAQITSISATQKLFVVAKHKLIVFLVIISWFLK